jgi:hypothetical protein
MDRQPVCGVERPNHGLAHSVRKAMLVLPVATAFHKYLSGKPHFGVNYSKERYDIFFGDDRKPLHALQLAALFEVCGRESDIGHADCQEVFGRFHKKSMDEFQTRASGDDWVPQQLCQLCHDALERMYCHPKTEASAAFKFILEFVHDLDLLRCYPADKMQKKIVEFKKILPDSVVDLLFKLAESLIIATGDRTIWPSRRDYQAGTFQQCSTNARTCIDMCKQKCISACEELTGNGGGGGGGGGFTFGTSHFKRAYDAAVCPEYSHELLGPVTKIVAKHAKLNKLPHSATTAFLKLLQSEWTLTDPIAIAAQKVWTSAQQMAGGGEFCSIYGAAMRVDSLEMAPFSATLARALNENLVTRGVALGEQAFPRGPGGGPRDKSTETATCFRGGGFMDNATTRAFFAPGNKYRVSQFLSTSFERRTAEKFMRRARMTGPSNARVVWRVELDPDRGCDHVNLVTETHVEGESEFLFVAFSAFEVVRVNWSYTPQDPATPHEITIRSAPNNRHVDFPEDLILAPWC